MGIDPGVSLDPTMASIKNENMIARTGAIEQNMVAQGASGESDPTKIKVTSLEDLRENHPKVYRAIEESIFEQIRRDNDAYQKRLIRRIKEQREGG